MRLLSYLLVVALLAIFPATGRADTSEAPERFYSIPLHSRDQVDLLAFGGASIRHRLRDRVIVYVDDATARRLERLGFDLTQLERDPALPSEASLRAETWHTNPEVDAELAALQLAYPTLAQRFTLGYSVENRPIHGIVIRQDVGTPREAMKIRVLGCHHGNEFMSVELPLRLARYLLDNYATDEQVRELVDSFEFTIVPLVNPDGRQRESRSNANNIDLNRNFGYQYRPGNTYGDMSSSGMFSQPEVRAVADHHFTRNFTLSLSYHTTESYVNYFWNYSPQPTPDETLVAYLAGRYADLADYDPTQGYSWYQTYGDTNDWSYGMRGSIDFTIETANKNIGLTFDRNLPAMLDFFEQGKRGLYGVVTDAENGDALHAMILCADPNWPVYTDPEVGDYYRLLLAGDYECLVYAPGYLPGTISKSLVDNEDRVRADVALEPGGGYYAFQVPALATHFQSGSYSPKILGPPDGQGLALSAGSMVIVDMLSEITHGARSRIVVHEEDPENDKSYHVYVSTDYTGPWILLGTGAGTRAFSLSPAAALTGLRFVKVAVGGASVPGTAVRVRVDAVAYDPDYSGEEDGDTDGDEDGDEEPFCELPFECFTLVVNRPEDCARQTVRGMASQLSPCTIGLPLCPMCRYNDPFTVTLQMEHNQWVGPQDCRVVPDPAGEGWLMSGNCGMGPGVNGTLVARECRETESETPICIYTCGGCGADGDEPDGDEPDGDLPDGDEPDGDVPDGDRPDGDDPDGDDTDGDFPLPTDGDRDDEETDGPTDDPDGDRRGDTPGAGSAGSCHTSGGAASPLMLLGLLLGLGWRRDRQIRLARCVAASRR